MKPTANIDDVRRSRDAALDALDDVMDAIDAKIAEITEQGTYLKQLRKRYEDLQSEYDNINRAAISAVLTLPDVTDAITTLRELAVEMKQTAQELTEASKLLDKGTTLLSLGQRFSDVIAKAGVSGSPRT